MTNVPAFDPLLAAQSVLQRARANEPTRAQHTAESPPAADTQANPFQALARRAPPKAAASLDPQAAQSPAQSNTHREAPFAGVSRDAGLPPGSLVNIVV